jgi:predicted HTH transcriptional regulator
MQILSVLAERFNRSEDAKIIECLQQCGTMTETALHAKTDIDVPKLRSRLESLAHKELVNAQLTRDMGPIWSIHHPRITPR